MDNDIFINEDRDSKKLVIIDQVQQFMRKIEQVSYLVVHDIINIYSQATLPSKKESDKELPLFTKVLTSIDETKKFITDYRDATKDNSALND